MKDTKKQLLELYGLKTWNLESNVSCCYFVCTCVEPTRPGMWNNNIIGVLYSLKWYLI